MLRKLIAIRLRSFLLGVSGAGKRGKRGKCGGTLAYIALVLFVVLAFSGMSAMLAIMLAGALIPAGLDTSYFALFNIVTFTVVFVFSVFETKSGLYDCKDNELLLSMPIPSGKIVLSRVISVLLLNLAESGIIMIPAIVVYAAFGGSAFIGVGALITMLLIALGATSLASGVGYMVAQISSYFKNRSTVTVIISVVLFVAYLVGYIALLGWVEGLGYELAADELQSSLGGIGFLGEISLMNKPAFFIFAACCILASVSAYLIISITYTAVITRSRSGKNTVYKERYLKGSSELAALCKKELARFISSPTYILNGALGSVMAVVAAAYILIGGRELLPMLGELLVMLGFADYNAALCMLLCGSVVLISSMNMISASSVSIEGGSFWVIKTAPVSSISVLLAKLVPHLAISVPCSLISSVLIGIALGTDIIGWLSLIVLPLLCNLLFALLGLIINILIPKLEFTSEAQVIKQSGAVFFSMLGSMLLSVALIGGGVGLVYLLGGVCSFVILALCLITLVSVMLVLLLGALRRRFEKL